MDAEDADKNRIRKMPDIILAITKSHHGRLVHKEEISHGYTQIDTD